MILRKRSPMRAAASFPKVDRLNSVISTSQESAEFSAIYSKRRKNSVTTMIPHGHGCTVVLFSLELQSIWIRWHSSGIARGDKTDTRGNAWQRIKAKDGYREPAGNVLTTKQPSHGTKGGMHPSLLSQRNHHIKPQHQDRHTSPRLGLT